MKRLAATIGFLLQIVAIFAVFLPSIALLRGGTPVTLLTVPVDPRSIFRGDYVVLDYEAGQGLPLDWPYGTPVYVVLQKKGDVYERVRLSETRPALLPGQVCLRGMPEYNRVDFRDIAQFFVPEGQGLELEQAQRSRRLYVDIAVSPSCRAAIQGVRLGPEAPLPTVDPFPPAMRVPADPPAQ